MFVIRIILFFYARTAYLDWLLTCLTYLIGQCEWGHHKNLLISLSNTLIELIMSFHGAGTVSFMGLSITRNSIICLNHLLHQMQVNFNKNVSTDVILKMYLHFQHFIYRFLQFDILSAVIWP